LLSNNVGLAYMHKGIEVGEKSIPEKEP